MDLPLIIQDDILWARKRTEDITETRVPIKRVPFSFIDVGGQRAQRAKWFQCFQESINTILFFVSISEYDQTLVEDTNQNRVIEALKVCWPVTSGHLPPNAPSSNLTNNIFIGISICCLSSSISRS